MSKWCDEWGMKISVAKSTAVVFTQRRTYQNPSLSVKGEKLEISNKVKFLGLIFDSKLTWAEHVKYIENKCKSRLNLMRCLTGT